MNEQLNLVAEDVHITYRSYLDPQVDLRSRLKRGRSARRRHIDIHAVRGVSFDLHAGESIGIIGHNGAGKSTMLLGLAGLIELDDGRVAARSRPTLLGVASVLNMALSGRRNIEIGCLAMGMTREEVGERIDDLIDFSGLSESIDLPLKAYSSGMRARLSFTVATVVEPEVLLIDEALAVGDADFRSRATSRLEEIRGAAGSVVLVSHNMAEIERMCDRVIWMHQGLVVRDGLSKRVVRMYNATKANPLLLDSVTDTESAGIGPLRSMPLSHILDQRYGSDQVDQWTPESRRESPELPATMAKPVAVDLDDATETQRAVLGKMFKTLDRPAYQRNGAVLQDWVLDHSTGALFMEWPSATAPRQAILLGETSSPWFPRWHDGWDETDSGDLTIDREFPHVDTRLELVYCMTRFPKSAVHWWADVATSAHLALTSPELDSYDLLVPATCTDFQLDALAALGAPAERLYSKPEGLERLRRVFFAGATQFGPRDATILDPALLVAARAARSVVLPSGPASRGRKLYIPRRGRLDRQIRNETDLEAALTSVGFEVVFPGQLSFSELVDVFAGADVVVGATMDDLAGVMFSDPGTAVIELLPDTFASSVSWSLSRLAGHRHAIVVGRAFGDGREHSLLAIHDNMRVPIDAVMTMLDRMDVPPGQMSVAGAR